ncbi:growth hormone secretagogue receptor type 1-like [Mizuhopecten yessoensis]|uniref:D(2) dopamine receptor A n=1 Tax=Mizuhopecten yessoensis TaxID=6573 RepID=A0A210QZI1_MIZYE|nr:growth hormone secretagogue receptor type 1-like [Mizuhopecten yessoensis]OWF54160.1 D(2) dopamine receptor A [Mizuhopecten yessoensis]
MLADVKCTREVVSLPLMGYFTDLAPNMAMENKTVAANQSALETLQLFGATSSSIPWTLEYITLAVYLTLFSVIGTLGNIPILIVYFHRNDHTTANTFIKVLAIIDLLVCSFIMPYTMVYELHMVRNDVVCRTFEFLRHFVIVASNLTLVAIAVERYIAVCRLTLRMSVQNVNRGMIFIAFCSMLFGAPSVGIFAVVSDAELTNVSCAYDHSVTHSKFCHFTYAILGETLVTLYQGGLMVIFLLTFLFIVVLYLIVYTVLWKKTKLRKRMTGIPKEFSLTSEASQSYSEPHKNKIDWEYSKVHIHADETAVVTNASSQGPEVTADVVTSVQKTKLNVAGNTYKFHDVFKRIRPSSKVDSGDKIRRRNHRKTAKMLFLCTVIYLITWLPFWLDIFGITKNMVLRYLFFIGNATNPIVYGIVNCQVRKSLKKLCGEFVQKCTIGRTPKGSQK